MSCLAVLPFVFVTCADLIFTLHFISSRCDNKLSSEDVVKRVLAGEKGDGKGRTSLTSRPPEADSRPVRDEQPRAPKHQEVRCKLHVLGSEARSLCVFLAKTFISDTVI